MQPLQKWHELLSNTKISEEDRNLITKMITSLQKIGCQKSKNRNGSVIYTRTIGADPFYKVKATKTDDADHAPVSIKKITL